MSQKPITVLYLVTELNVGGAERNLYELARRIDRTRYRPLVVALQGGGPISGWLADAGVPVHDLNLGSVLDIGCFFRLVKLIRRERVDILHSFLFHPNLLGRIAGAIGRVSIVISSARVAEPARPWRAWLDGATQCLIDVETCVSDSVARFTHNRGGVPWRKLVTIRNGVDLSRFTATRSEARSQLKLDPNVPIVVFVGRLDRQKAADLIPRIAQRVRDQIPNVRFLLVGAGPLEGLMRNECRRLGIGDAIDFMGRRDDVPVILSAGDILMLPSRWEGFANVVLEAQAARTACVVTDVEGIREAIDPGRTGVVVPPGQPDLFADEVAGLLNDPGRRQAIAEAGHSRAGELFTIERMVEANRKLYEDLLARKGLFGA